MANPLYGFSLYKSPTNSANEEYPIIGANSEAFTVGDPVVMLSGFAHTLADNNATALASTVPVIGIASKTVTMASTNQTSAKVAVPYVPVDQRYTFLAGADGELSLTTHPGLFFTLWTGGTGSIPVTGQFLGVVATSATALYAATTPVLCVGVDPFGEGTTGVGGGSRKGLFRFVRSQETPQQGPM